MPFIWRAGKKFPPPRPLHFLPASQIEAQPPRAIERGAERENYLFLLEKNQRAQN